MPKIDIETLKIGEFLQVGGVKWPITIEENLKAREGYLTAGLADLDLCFIKLDKELDSYPEAQFEKLCHELLHILLDRGAGIRPDNEMVHDERLIESMTPLFHQMIKQIIEWQG